MFDPPAPQKVFKILRYVTVGAILVSCLGRFKKKWFCIRTNLERLFALDTEGQMFIFNQTRLIYYHAMAMLGYFLCERTQGLKHLDKAFGKTISSLICSQRPHLKSPGNKKLPKRGPLILFFYALYSMHF